jgi:hypothetical protein
VAAAEFTVMAEELTLREPELAVMVWEPTVLRVALKVAVPFVKVAAAGRVAFGSDEVNPTEPLNPVAIFPFASRAVTEKLKALPAPELDGTKPRTREAAPDGLIFTFALVPTATLLILAPRVTTPLF